jgi:hypothetical protein
MPKKGEVAVIAVGMNYYSEEFTHIVEDSVIQELLSAGYKVVDEAENTIDTGRHRGYTGSVTITFNAKNSGGDYTRASQSPIMTTGAGVTPDKATNRAVIAAAAKVAAALTR